MAIYQNCIALQLFIYYFFLSHQFFLSYISDLIWEGMSLDAMHLICSGISRSTPDPSRALYCFPVQLSYEPFDPRSSKSMCVCGFFPDYIYDTIDL